LRKIPDGRLGRRAGALLGLREAEQRILLGEEGFEGEPQDAFEAAVRAGMSDEGASAEVEEMEGLVGGEGEADDLLGGRGGGRDRARLNGAWRRRIGRQIDRPIQNGDGRFEKRLRGIRRYEERRGRDRRHYAARITS
jgi:hypothetical protein